MSKGNFWEAVFYALNSSSSKPTANLMALKALVSLITFRFLTLRHINRFVETLTSLITLYFSALRYIDGFANNKKFSLLL